MSFVLYHGILSSLTPAFHLSPITNLVGVYAIQLVLDGEPLTLYVDDQFPVLEPSFCNSSNRGIAMAYIPEMQYSWVSLLEKSFAKLYGNYAQLEVGHTWQVSSSSTSQHAYIVVVFVVMSVFAHYYGYYFFFIPLPTLFSQLSI